MDTADSGAGSSGAGSSGAGSSGAGSSGTGTHEVVIVGGGPTGMMLAAELAIAGVDVAVVERREHQQIDDSRAGGLHSRTIEVLDQRGVADRFLAAGRPMQVQAFAGIPLDIGDFPTRHPYGLALWQSHFEPILAAWVEELGVPVLRGREAVGVRQDGHSVEVRISATADASDVSSLRGSYVVGCDGGRSVVRSEVGIDSVGSDPTTSWIVAEVVMDGEPEFGMRHDEIGSHGMNPLGPGGPIRLVVTERSLGRGTPDLAELRDAIVAVYGSDFGLRGATWISRFTDLTRQAVTYRRGRVLIAGDAAHVHPPQGGQGLNVGVQDAVNLGWKLAQVVRGTSPDSLLDTYTTERHPVAARVLHNTLAAVALTRPGERHQALRDIVGDLLKMDEPRRHLAAMFSGLDVTYDLGQAAHPVVGRRVPDLDLQTDDGTVRVFELLRAARPVLLAVDASTDASMFDLGPWADSVVHVRARCDAPWVLPLVGEVPAPAAVLVRPDGHVAWAGGLDDPALPAALTTWFGPGRA